jgi:hypothetical protein
MNDAPRQIRMFSNVEKRLTSTLICVNFISSILGLTAARRFVVIRLFYFTE